RERILGRAWDRTLPVLERVKFLAIFDRAIDEFFQVDVARLLERERERGGNGAGLDDRPRAGESLATIARAARRLHAWADVVVHDVSRELEEAAIGVCDWSALDSGERAF